MFDDFKSLFDRHFLHPKENLDLPPQYQKHHLPTIWLLGKTGAGKSSLMKALTNGTNIDIGNGFSSCTLHTHVYPFPSQHPSVKFLDTRGLVEVNYDPTEDIALATQCGHLLTVVTKVEDIEQSDVLTALKVIKRSKKIKHILLVYTAIKQVSEVDAQRLIQYQQTQFEQVWGQPIAHVAVDFECDNGTTHQLNTLIDSLSEQLPIIGLMIEQKDHLCAEEDNFDQLENDVLWYAGTASATDLLPAVGLVSVPAIQAKLLHSLATQYGIHWDKRVFSEFIGALGTTFSLQYGVRLGIRELVKFVPYYGKTLGAMTAAVMSFGTTYGLGRVACYFFYQKKYAHPIDTKHMKKLYQQAFLNSQKVIHHEPESFAFSRIIFIKIPCLDFFNGVDFFVCPCFVWIWGIRLN